MDNNNLRQYVAATNANLSMKNGKQDGQHAYDNYTFYPDDETIDMSNVTVDTTTTESGDEVEEEIAVQIKDVVLSYGNHKVLDEINMNVPVKRIYALLGPSGCGEFVNKGTRGTFTNYVSSILYCCGLGMSRLAI